MSIDYSNKTPYEVLNVSPSATEDEIKESYSKLKEKYLEDRFLPGEAGNDAAEMLGLIEDAYSAIMTERNADGFVKKAESSSEQKSEEAQAQGASTENSQKESVKIYADVDKLIKAGKIDEAQQALDSYDERLAEWHYLQAVIYYKKNWGNECKKQMEIAINKEPDNAKYQDAYQKLCKEIEYKSKNFTSGNADVNNKDRSTQRDFDPYDRQMGGNSCMSSCCECLACNMLLNCCCNCH